MRRAIVAVLVFSFIAGCVVPNPFAKPTSAGARVDQLPTTKDTIRTHGYITTRDNTSLEYTVVRPKDDGRYPTLFEYSGYNPGSSPDQAYIDEFLPRGYAYIGVNVRGTGCSSGVFDFFEPRQATDGYDVVEWVAKQSWSDGSVAMIGKSFPGITQLFVAETQPPHLVAIAPGHFYSDAYRDVAYPGGILNYAFASLWSFVVQPQPGTQAAAGAAPNDAQCQANVKDHSGNAAKNPFVQAQQHTLDDALFRERSTVTHADRIRVPMFVVESWEDEQLESRGLELLPHVTAPYHVIVTNGDHGMYRTATALKDLERFYDFHLRHVANGFDKEPAVTVWWDTPSATRAPGWLTSEPSWPPANTTPLTLWLDANGALTPTKPTASSETPDAYAYPGPGGTDDPGYGFDPLGLGPQISSTAPANPGSRATFTTAPFATDTLVLGSGNLTFWAASTAPDTDFQITLSEVSPDGKSVTFVQNGWLRASHRHLDALNSSLYIPVVTHDRVDMLTPGTPDAMSVEIFPFGHAFRAGSRLRLDVETPYIIPQLWGFQITPTPATNLIYHDATHPSTLILPVLAGMRAGGPEPACGSLVREPCRTLTPVG
ncbi:MAG: CocE/NonD family hydrolase [Thermoplasmatota archaeon]